MADEKKVELKKLSSKEVDGLKGKLLEVRRIGASPIYIAITKKDTIENALEKADIPTDDEIKVEAIKAKGKSWQAVELDDNVYQFSKVAVTTKVSGSF